MTSYNSQYRILSRFYNKSVSDIKAQRGFKLEGLSIATIEERVIRNEESISEHDERLSAIEAIMPHLATKADLKALENKLLWAGIGITSALVVNILMTLLR